jgi:cation transport ATPase
MANHDDAIQTTRGEGHMLQAAILLAVCLLIGFIALAICAWVAVSGRLFTMDGLLMVAISLTAAAFFVGNFAWSLHTGEVREILSQLRSGKEESGTEGHSAGEGKA